MTRDEHTTNRPTPGGSAFQETVMDDYLTRVAEAVRDATLNKAWQIGNNGPLRSAVDLPAVIASVPRPEPVSNNAISQLLCAVQYYGSCKWSEGMGLIADPTLADVRAAWDGVYESVQSLYAEPVAAQVAVPEQWQAVARECVSHLDDGRTQPALSRSLRKLSAMLDSSVAPPVSVSHGWKLVPVEPTPGMLMAAGAAVHAATYWHRAYCAMLAATPEAPQTIQCNACDWIGSSADALYLGGREPIGPLCPECHETTGPADDAATLEAPEPVLDRPASIGGTTFGVGIPVRTLVAAAQRRYEVEQTPASLADRQALIDALRRPVVDAEIATLRSAIRAMASMLQAREWAEHVSTDPDVTDLEVQITELVGTATKLREQNATLGEAISLQHANGEALAERVMQAEAQNVALVAAMQNIADEFVPGDEQKLYGTPTDVLDRIRSTARAALASAKGGAQ